jgi:hypothetical protein
MRELAPPDPARVAALPSLRWLSIVGVIAVLGPGLGVFGICRLSGLGTGAAGSWALLAMLLGLVAYPAVYLRRLGKRLDT